MPYIPNEARKKFWTNGDVPFGARAENIGELTYFLYKTIGDYLRSREQLNFAELAAIMGSLQSVQGEFYRKIVVPYENIKMTDNGDVY